MISCRLVYNGEWVLKQRTALVAAVTPLETSVGAVAARAEDPEGTKAEHLMALTCDSPTL